MITKESRLNEIVNDNPRVMDLFNSLNIDYCCSGSDTLDLAASKNDIDVDELIKMIEEQPKSSESEKTTTEKSIELFRTFDIEKMISELIYTHHTDEREMLSELDKLVNKILIVHYKTHGEELIELHRLFSMLKMELEAHLAKEEQFIFPLMEDKEPSKESIELIKTLEEEHLVAGDIIKAIQELTNNFEVPDDVCPTYVRTYEVMDKLIKDIFVHIFKENSILFPKYEELVN